ncbi:DUF3793 family protein [Terrisporobacter sp.]
MIDNLLIKYASPTLGGIKSGSLFKIYKDILYDLEEEIKNYNLLLNSLGLYLNIIYSCQKYDLVYIYRLNMILNDLNNIDTQNFLKSYGYDFNSIDNCILHLKYRFKILKKTPHEIGIFLGYPLEDVISFIKYNGKNFKICGAWKVYSNVDDCLYKFDKFKKYRKVFTYLYNHDIPLECLVFCS